LNIPLEVFKSLIFSDLRIICSVFSFMYMRSIYSFVDSVSVSNFSFSSGVLCVVNKSQLSLI